MFNCHMIPWEMAELSDLLKLYIDIYSPDCASPKELLNEIRKRIDEQPDKSYTESNPRGAGRRPGITLQQKNDVIKLFKLNKSIRSIAKETNLSIGSVHKLINEHRKANQHNDS